MATLLDTIEVHTDNLGHRPVNLRDLARSSEGIVSPGKVFRSASPAACGNTVIFLVNGLEIKTIIDLREKEESRADRGYAQTSSALAQAYTLVEPHREEDLVLSSTSQGRRVFYIPCVRQRYFVWPTIRRATTRQLLTLGYYKLTRQRDKAITLGFEIIAPIGLQGLNELMLEHSKRELCLALKIVANPDHHPVLIHCSHGKDRTGIVCALILACAGVSEKDIVADYTASEELGGTRLCQRDLQRRMSASGIGLDWAKAEDSVMRETFKYIHDKYGGVASYLASIGFDAHWQEKLRDALHAPLSEPEQVRVARISKQLEAAVDIDEELRRSATIETATPSRHSRFHIFHHHEDGHGSAPPSRRGTQETLTVPTEDGAGGHSRRESAPILPPLTEDNREAQAQAEDLMAGTGREGPMSVEVASDNASVKDVEVCLINGADEEVGAAAAVAEPDQVKVTEALIKAEDEEESMEREEVWEDAVEEVEMEADAAPDGRKAEEHPRTEQVKGGSSQEDTGVLVDGAVHVQDNEREQQQHQHQQQQQHEEKGTEASESSQHDTGVLVDGEGSANAAASMLTKMAIQEGEPQPHALITPSAQTALLDFLSSSTAEPNALNESAHLPQKSSSGLGAIAADATTEC